MSEVFDNLSFFNHLNAISEAVGAQLNSDIVRLKPKGGTKEVLKGRCASSRKESPLYYGFDESDGQFYHV